MGEVTKCFFHNSRFCEEERLPDGLSHRVQRLQAEFLYKVNSQRLLGLMGSLFYR
jgi:hypothetical protein